MAISLGALEELDVRTLQGLLQMKKNKTLTRLAARRDELQSQLDYVEADIDDYLRTNPGARRLMSLLQGEEPAATGRGRKKRGRKKMTRKGNGRRKGRKKATRKKTTRKKTTRKKATRGRATASGRNPHGWLRDQIEQTLKAARGPQSPAEIRDAILAHHPRDNERSFYVSIVQQLKKHPEFKKTAQGYSLR